jgi:hypothetical protein
MDWLPGNTLTQGVLVFCFTLGGLLLLERAWSHYRNLRHRERRAMSTRQRRSAEVNALLNTSLSSVVGDVIEDLAYRGLLKKGECRQICKRFGYSGLVDLLPGKAKHLRIQDRCRKAYPVPDQLKEEIKERVKNGTNKPVNLPDETKPENKFQAMFTNRLSRSIP